MGYICGNKFKPVKRNFFIIKKISEKGSDRV